MRPKDQDAKAKFTECKKIVQQIAFHRAIAVEEKIVSVVDNLNLEGMAVEDTYDGPRLAKDAADEKKLVVTEEFMLQLMKHYKNQKKLHKRYAFQILVDARAYFMQLPSLVDIEVDHDRKFTICGDIHGQYFDLMNIFELNGLPSPENPYLFNGDFVDRGSFSVECIFVLLGFKLLYPNHFFMARGNHESENMNKMYGFEGEVKAKYSGQMVDLFTEVYNWLPLSHCINKKVLVMHGGLFSKVTTLRERIRDVDNVRDLAKDKARPSVLTLYPREKIGNLGS